MIGPERQFLLVLYGTVLGIAIARDMWGVVGFGVAGLVIMLLIHDSQEPPKR